jgi:hypothetical protein
MNIEQQPGEYVPDVDVRGADISAEDAPFREREELQVSPQPADPEAERLEALRAAGKAIHPLTAHRLQISAMARRKPIPSGELADREYAAEVESIEAELNKTRAMVREETAAADKARREREKAGIAPEKPRRAALKFPADHWLPHII